MSTGYPKIKRSYITDDVLPNYLYEVENEAYTMINKYDKEQAKEEATLLAESYIERINNTKYYDAEKIDLWNKRALFWFNVARSINNWK